MSKTHKERETVFAIIRLDLFQEEIENQVTVKEVVFSEEIAISEVERLNGLKADNEIKYFYQMTRLFPPGKSSGN